MRRNFDSDNLDPPKFHGGCMGVDLEERGPKDPHIIIALCVEDDGNWSRQMSFSSAWLDEMIEVLQEAKTFCETQTPDKFCGWNFKAKKAAKKRKK